MADMFGKATWDVFCPFKGVTSRVEVKLTDRGRRGNSLYPTVKRGSFSQPVQSQGTAVEVGTLDVSSKDYLVFEVREWDKGTRGQSTRVVLSYPHMRKFLEGLREAEQMLIPPPDTEAVTYPRPFEPTDDGLIKLTEYGESQQASAKVAGLYDGASLEFAPIIWERKGETEETSSSIIAGDAGVRMYVNSYTKFGECTLEDFLAFTHFHERFSLFDVSRDAITLAAASGSLAVPARGAGRDASGTVEQPIRRQK